MVREQQQTQQMTVVTQNPFALLGTKQVSAALRERKAKTEKIHQPDADEVVPVVVKAAKKSKKGKDDVTVEKEPVVVLKKESKTISLTAEMHKEEEKKNIEKELKKEEKKEAKVDKKDMDQRDRQDRSGKGSRVRKEGKGTGGWEESALAPEEASATPVEPEDAPAWGEPAAETTAASQPVEAKPARVYSDEEKKKQEEERKAKELEEKQMTYDEYLIKQKAEKVNAEFNIRTVVVDNSAFANMKLHRKGVKVVLKVPKKEATAAAVTPKKAAEPEKKAEKKKVNLQETGFRMDNPAMGGSGRGGRGGRGGREGGGRGGRAFFGRGRGGYNAVDNTPRIDSEELFPSLGGKVAPVPAETPVAESTAA